jgi:uncharacterized protein
VTTVRIGDMRFEWDAEKAAGNVAKHRVTFDEAATVFADPHALDAADFDDPDRLVIVGISRASRVLFVVYAERVDRATIRIITARKASPTQRKRYERR